MKTGRVCPGAKRAFTLVELLTVIAIIAVLAAILFPIFGTVREQARQSSTMSNLQSIYVATKLFYEDEQRYPASLFGYAETASGTPAQSSDIPNNIIPMADSKQQFKTFFNGTEGLNKGYLFNEQVKSVNTFFSPGNLVTDQKAVTEVYYPKQVSDLLGLPFPTMVTWKKSSNNGCARSGDTDIPGDSYEGASKIYYAMDSMDIGPMVDSDGKWMKDSNGYPMYELHYSPDWTGLAGIVNGDVNNACSDAWTINGNRVPVLNQMKWKNPPTDKTVLTYVTHHAAYSGSPNVIVLLLSGTARKISVSQAAGQLPLNYSR
jgi:prepilin-type N-terminal cleavage/methylation domain-containing protein